MSLKPQHDIGCGLQEGPRRDIVCWRAQRHNNTRRAAREVLLRNRRYFPELVCEDERRLRGRY